MSKKFQVNLTTRVNNRDIRRETRNGREYLIVPSATLPDNVIMNRILYPADAIEEGFMTLNRKPAPAGHPMVNGRYISAYEPEAINEFWIGAYNENVRRENGRVFADKAIDVENAGRTEKGKAVLAAIEKGDPVHTSTGLYLEVDEVNEEKYDYVVKSMTADHDAILVNQEGAATPEQGVGLMVNNRSESEEVDVINSDVLKRTFNESGSMRDLEQRIQAAISDLMPDANWTWLADWGEDWAIIEAEESYFRVQWSESEDGTINIEGDPEPVKRVTMWEAVTNAAKRLFNRSGDTANSSERAAGLNANSKSEGDTMDQKELDQIAATVTEKLTANNKDVATQVANAVQEAVKPLADTVKTIQETMTANEEAERKKDIDVLVNAGVLESADDAEGMKTNTLKSMAEKAREKGQPGDNGHGYFASNSGNNDFGIPGDLPGGGEAPAAK